MPASLTDRQELAELPAFVERVRGAMFKVANDVGLETAAAPSDRSEKRQDLINRVFGSPDVVQFWFSRAAAGWNPASPATDIADTYVDTAGTPEQKLAAVTDATLIAYVAGAWNTLAGVRPWERT